MTDIAFYHLERSLLETALPQLLEKTLEAEERALVLAASDARVEALADVLWAYKNESWLPHGTVKDGFAGQQPIWLSTLDENANDATFLFLIDGAKSDHVGSYQRCFEMLDGNDPDAVAAARGRWKMYKDVGYTLAYWQQTATGGWSKKG